MAAGQRQSCAEVERDIGPLAAGRNTARPALASVASLEVHWLEFDARGECGRSGFPLQVTGIGAHSY